MRLSDSQRKYYKQKPAVGIGRDLAVFSGVKISLDAGFPSRICRTCHLEVIKFQEFVKMLRHSKAQKESISRSKRGKTVRESPSSTTSPGMGREEKKGARSGAWNLCYAEFLLQ